MGSKQPSPASGVYAALATPRRFGSIDGDAVALLDYLDVIVRAGVDGLVLFGSTGEFVHFDLAERMRLLAFAARRSRVPILVNVSHTTLAGAVELTGHAIECGANGVLLLPPYIYSYSDLQLTRFYEEFGKLIGGKIPIYLYNLPLLQNSISLDLAEHLLASGTFAGIKDSSGDWAMFEGLGALRSTRHFQLFAGAESIYLRARFAGADGIISGVAAALPELIVALDRAIRISDLAQAHRLDRRLQEFVAWLAGLPVPLGIKQAAAARGWKHGDFAVPLDDQTVREVTRFEAWLGDWMPAVLMECSESASSGSRF